MSRRVLIVDPDRTSRAALEQDFVSVAFAVATAESADEAVSTFTATSPDLVVLDLSLGARALELVRRWTTQAPKTVVVLVSGNPSFTAVVGALNEGAKRFFAKPVRAATIVDQLEAPTHELGTAGLDADGVDRFFAISPGLLAIQGFDGFFKMVNPAWEKTLGYTADELCATPYLELVHPDDRDKATDEALEIRGGQTVFRFRNRYRCKDGTYRWLAWSATPSPEHRLIYASARDVTAVVRMEQGLRASNELLKRAALAREQDIRETARAHEHLVELDRFKDEITATLVHDLKNPLSVIVANYDYIVESYDGPADCLEALRDSQGAGQRILRLLSNLVDVARLEIGELELHPKLTSISKLALGIVDQRRVLAQSRRLTLSVVPGPELSGEIDVDLVTRAIENILDNALRYTPVDGTIEIAMHETATDIEIRIGNSGSAIPRELREVVFQRYGQARGNVGSMNLGLGLHFCRKTIEAHGGRIWIDETARMPTVFVIQLPLVASRIPRVSDDTKPGAVGDVGHATSV